MVIDIVTKDELETFRMQLLNDLKELLSLPTAKHEKPWLKSAEVRKLLNLSPSTLQKLRIKGILRYTRVGTILYYKYEDIVKIMENNTVK